MNADVPLLIIGGGIGGLTAALALARAGFTAHVVERSPEFGEIGAGIQLAPNALRILDELGVLPGLATVAVRPRRLVLMHADTGSHLTTLDFGEPFRRRYGYPYTVMHRGDLLIVLHEACQADGRITLESGREVTGLDEHGVTTRVRFADGGAYECGAVVGADGLWSTARKLVSDDRPHCDAFVAYRGTLPANEVALFTSRDSAPAGPDDEIIWIGPHKHFVQYPIRPGELYNQVAVFRSWRYSPAAEPSGDWGTPAELDEGFASSCDQVRAGVALIDRDRRWVMYDREPMENWTTGRVTLLGDAAHPMVQYLAQGACQAIEDAGCLARQLAASDGDIDKAFAAYQAERIPRTAQVQRAARTWGQIWHDDGAVVPLLRDRIFTQRDYDDYTDLDWLYRDPRAGDLIRRPADQWRPT
jgi:2-polyprenyl-6-methoxyphenol hydroxylase-like FAD-dependent oxidoreductase